MHLKLLVNLLQELHVLRRQMTKLVNDCFRRLRRLQPVRLLDNLFLSCNCRYAVHQRDQVYLDEDRNEK